MRTGNLRDELSFERQLTTKNTVGEAVNTWSELFTRRCSIEPLNGKEYFTTSGEHADATTRVRLRYDHQTKDLRASDRAIDRTVSPQTIYDIDAVITPNNRSIEQVLFCRRL